MHFQLAMGPGKIFSGSGQVNHLWFEFGFGKYPLKISNFAIFLPSNQKIISSVQVKKYSGLRQIDTLFTAGQK